MEFEKSFLQQMATRVLHGKDIPSFEGDVCVTCTIYYPTRRNDLDPSLIFDIMEKAGIYKNDRQIKEQHIYHGLDKEKPRVEIEVKEM